MENKKTVIWWSIIAVICASSLIFWNVPAESEEEHEEEEHEEVVRMTPEQIQASGIAIEKAAPGTLQKVVQSTGKVSINEDRVVHIVPKASGIVLKTRKNIGEQVKAGEVLAQLQSRELAEAKSAYLAALKKLQMANGVLDTEQKLFDKKVSAAQDYHTAKGTADQAQIDVDLTKQKLHAFGLSKGDIDKLAEADPETLGIYEMVSPITGTVIMKEITPGEMLTTDRETYIIADLNTVWGDIVVYPNDLPTVKEGQIAEITCSDGRSAKGKIIYRSPTINDETRTARAIMLINNREGKWHPGTYFCSGIRTQAEQAAVVVPKEAIQKVEGNNVVFVFNNDLFEIRPVVLGNSDSKNIEITSGLEAGEQFAASNTFILKADHGKHEAEHMD